MIVMKFGGTSVEDARAITQAIALVARQKDNYPVVVLSAIAGATDALLKSADLSVSDDFNRANSILNDLLERHVLIAENLIESRSVVQQLIFDLRKQFEELRNLCRSIAILGELTKRSIDTIAAMGELASSLIFAEAIRSRKLDAVWIDAREFIITDDHFGNATPLFDDIGEKARGRIMPHIRKKQIVITQGFIGATRRNVTTTLCSR